MSTFNQNYDHTNNRPPNPRDQCEELVVKPFGKTTKNVQYLSHAVAIVSITLIFHFDH